MAAAYILDSINMHAKDDTMFFMPFKGKSLYIYISLIEKSSKFHSNEMKKYQPNSREL